MAFMATPIYVCSNHSYSQLSFNDSCLNFQKKNYSELGFQDSCLSFNNKNSCCVLGLNLKFPKWECLAVVGQRAKNPIDEDDKPLLSINEEADHSQITPNKTFHRDLNYLPRPLSSKDFVSASNDGSNVRVAHQGSPGAYSEVAALKAYPECETVPCDQFEDVFKAVELWLVEKAVLPIENSVGGSIHRNYDLLIRHRLHIVGEVKLVVNHCLLGLPGVRKEDLKTVLSHPQEQADIPKVSVIRSHNKNAFFLHSTLNSIKLIMALEQCKMTLDKLGVARESASDTGSAARIVASDGVRDRGAVASPRAAEVYGLNILEEKIQDDSDNVTRFLILAREPIIPGTDGPYKTSIVFTLEEGPGVLFKALAVFALRDISLTKIESRPQRKRPIRIIDRANQGIARYFDYLFYVDFEASMAEPRAQYALGHLQEFSRFLRILGSYPISRK